jgi:hypothetical protein
VPPSTVALPKSSESKGWEVMRRSLPTRCVDVRWPSTAARIWGEDGSIGVEGDLLYLGLGKGSDGSACAACGECDGGSGGSTSMGGGRRLRR